MLGRRGFISGTALLAVAPVPEIHTPPLDPLSSTIGGVAYQIEGWSTSTGASALDQVSIRINAGWRASWR
jgi:hypothetical protein